MKNGETCTIVLILLLLMVVTRTSEAQLNPSQTQAVVTFILTNPLDSMAWSNKGFTVVQSTTTRRWNLITNKKGEAEVLLPIGQEYTLHLSDWKDFAQISIPEEAFSRHRILMPCYDLENLEQGAISIPVSIQLIDSLGNPSSLKESLLIRGNCGKGPYKATTNARGMASFRLPIGCQYVLNLPNAPHYYKFELPNKPYSNWVETVLFERLPGWDKYASINEALFSFVFTNLDGEAVANENFWLIDKASGQRYEGSTNALGIAQILVPLYQEYSLHATHNKHFATYRTDLAADRDILVETIYYKSMTSKDWNRRQEERRHQALKRDSLTRVQSALQSARLDSIKNKKSEEAWIKQLLAEERAVPVKRTLRIRKAIRAKARRVEQQLKLNPRYAEDSQQPILAVLQRHAIDWAGKVVVTDVTESMQPYLDQVLIWHLLRLQKGERTSYVFFNDGNHKMASAKKIGETGGLYSCQGTWQEVDSVLNVLHYAMQCGLGGGEPPENDLEAVLFGMQQRQGVEELVLIADSYSRVRDIELVYQIDVPVRIILCGAEEQNQFYPHLKPDINEEYLTIAHRTNGSVHTLRQDILNLSAIKEGEIIEIGAHRYQLNNRQFIRLEK